MAGSILYIQNWSREINRKMQFSSIYLYWGGEQGLITCQERQLSLTRQKMQIWTGYKCWIAAAIYLPLAHSLPYLTGPALDFGSPPVANCLPLPSLAPTPGFSAPEDKPPDGSHTSPSLTMVLTEIFSTFRSV
jgi:hypothetical protein